MNDATYRISHSGDLGDIIYAAMSFRDLDRPVDLILTPKRGFTRAVMTSASASSLATLLCRQPYVASCRFDENSGIVDFDGDGFRELVPRMSGYANLAQVFRCFLGGLSCDETIPWLQVDQRGTAFPVLVHRAPRYLNPLFPWRRILDTYADICGVLGSDDEYRAMCELAGRELPHVRTENFLELAQQIAGCQLFIGNQSAPMSVAEGLKVTIIQEVFVAHPNCRFARPGVQYVFGEQVLLPSI